MSHEDAETENEVAPWDLLSDALGALDDLEETDEEFALDIKEVARGDSGGDGKFSKVPLEQAGNLIKLRKAADGLLEGRLTTQDYMNVLRPMQKALENGIKLIQTDAVASQIAALPEDQKALFLETQALIGILLEGISQMMRFQETGNQADVLEGLERIEAAFQELDEVQDEAIELGRELEAAEEAAEEEADDEVYDDEADHKVG